MSRRTPSPQTVVTLVVLALVVSALAPTRFTGWVTWFKGPLMAIVAPASGPASALGTWLRPSREERSPLADRDDAALLERIELLDRELARSMARVGELEAVIRDIQSGVAYPPDVAVSRREASRVGVNLSAGTIDVSRGRRHGVVEGAIAIARGREQLLGIVTQVGSLHSTVHLVTDRALRPGLMKAVVVPADRSLTEADLAQAPMIDLSPVGDGTLAANEVGAPTADRMMPGDRVRLRDDTWPSHAQMVVLGRITRIDNTDEPLFRRVVVTPEVEPGRLRSVILQIPEPVETPR